MIHDTHYTLSEAFEFIGRRLHGDEWTGDESDIGICLLTEDDIAARRARAEEAIEPTRFPGDGGPGGASENLAHLLALARDEQTEPLKIMQAALFAERRPDEEIEWLLLATEAKNKLSLLFMHAEHESLSRLRSGDPLSETNFALLDKLETKFHAAKRRESVMGWVTNRAWSGDNTETSLTGYIHTPDDGKITPMPAPCWGARSFTLTLYDDKATMDDQPWPADGVLYFSKSQLDAVLGSPKGGHVGRRPDSESQAAKVLKAFDGRSGAFTFKRGELARVASEIGQATGYKQNTVEKLIRPKYRELEEKERQPPL